jgi:hypothetical protein
MPDKKIKEHYYAVINPKEWLLPCTFSAASHFTKQKVPYFN